MSCFNFVRSWWIIYKCLKEEPTALTCNYTIKLFKRIDIHTILVHCCTLQPFYLHIIDLSSYKPLVAYKKASLRLTQVHQQRVTTHHMSCIIYCINIISYFSYLSLPMNFKKDILSYTKHISKFSIS